MAQLQALATDVWVIDHPLRVGGLHLGTRTTLVRLASGGLWMHSPGPLSPQLTADIAALGVVQALVAPNAMHHRYLTHNARAFPQATVYVSPALSEKLKTALAYEVLQTETPPLWRDDLRQHFIDGMPKLQEYVFLHRASQTLILTDLAFHIRHSDAWFTRLFMHLNGAYGHFGPSRIFRTLVKNRAALRASLAHLQKWEFERIIVAHGDILEHDGKAAMQTRYAWV